MPSHLDDYEQLEVIGTGSFGRVHKIRRKADGKVLVWKEIDYGRMTEREKQMLVSEVNILREFRSPHIVRYYDRIIDRERTRVFIVMEYCEGGDLASLIKRQRRERQFVDEAFVWRVCAQVALALQECHQRKEGAVLHRDLKPANVFLDGAGNVKLGDFGLARVLSERAHFAHTFVGTPFYMSPEQISETAYNDKSDVWSLGCLLYELCALVPPFDANTQKALAAKISDGRIKRLPAQYSDALNRTIRQMLQVDHTKRPGIEQLLATPQLQQTLDDGGSSHGSRGSGSQRRREEEMRAKETALDDREKQLAVREKALARRERQFNDRVARTEELVRDIIRYSITPSQSPAEVQQQLSRVLSVLSGASPSPSTNPADAVPAPSARNSGDGAREGLQEPYGLRDDREREKERERDRSEPDSAPAIPAPYVPSALQLFARVGVHALPTERRPPLGTVNTDAKVAAAPPAKLTRQPSSKALEHGAEGVVRVRSESPPEGEKENARVAIARPFRS